MVLKQEKQDMFIEQYIDNLSKRVEEITDTNTELQKKI